MLSQWHEAARKGLAEVVANSLRTLSANVNYREIVLELVIVINKIIKHHAGDVKP